MKEVTVKEKISEYILGEDNWEKIKSSLWTSVIFIWIILFPLIGLWSWLLPPIVFFFYREVNNEREKLKKRFYKFKYFRIKVWEDDVFNYDAWLSFNQINVYPLKIKKEEKAKLYLRCIKKDGKKIKSSILKSKQEDKTLIDKIKSLEGKINKVNDDLSNLSIREGEEDTYDDDELEEKQNEIKLKEEEKTELKNEIEKLQQLIKYGETDSKDEIELVELSEEIVTLLDENYIRNVPYLIEIEWADNIKQDKIILLTPSDFSSSFTFISRFCRHRGFTIENGQRCDISCFDFGEFQGIRIFKVRECNYTIAKSQDLEAKTQIIDIDLTDAKVSFMAHETGKKLQDFENMYLDNIETNQKYETLSKNAKLMKKKYLHDAKLTNEFLTEVKKRNITFKTPKKEYYAITIIGWCFTLVFMILWVLGV